MQNAIKELFISYAGKDWERIEKIPQSGGDRIYFRIKQGADSYIAAYNLNVKENETFIYFAQHFHSKGLPVPKVLVVSADQKIYLQEDLGTESLLDVLEREGKTERVYQLFQKSLKALVQLQVKGSEGLDYSKCLTSKTFGKHAVLTDLLYYKYYFLDTLQYPYDKQALIDEFELLSDQLSDSHFNYFMFRDFQSRNIVVKGEEVFFIDFQGGMKGGLPYDVASLLWQAKAELSNEWKERLLNDYIKEAEKVLGETIDTTVFKKQYHGFVLLRLLQPLGLKNLRAFLEVHTLDKDTPVFAGILKWMVGDEVLNRFTPIQATEKTPLVITINSFSYKKGLPVDSSDNGGGFIFDMRGILNPGRFDPYKNESGLDKPVQDFLEQKTKMNTFLNSVWDLIDITVEDYLARDFKSLQINFGCTGGQHRSVFAAEQTARHLKNKYKVKIVLAHTNQNNWVK